ncbi:Tim44-like domain-containing protein [Variovorax dokdonensis]|uniref:Tim44-like domain-containing protein n=1 Tax=Variovorax dokdonensis TaxID=344883 RepID=A0ABT7N6Z1_9BURK|nr:Tim44-like domain-containing protein [Variovorax dokdonensis]MDM0043699.1 Tim44-like domain-containing protein [Variovorax dokdonensis]
MKKLIPVLLSCALALASVHAEAKRMGGGGKSFGRQSGNVTQREAAPPTAPGNTASGAAAPGSGAAAAPASAAAAKPATAAGTAAAAAPKRPWGAMLGGLAAGLGLAWLANALGLGPAFANILLILLVVMAGLFIWRMFSARGQAKGGSRQGGLAFQGAGGPTHANAPAQYSPNNVGNDASARPWERHGTAFESVTASSGTGSLIGSALSGGQTWGVPAGFDTEGFLTAAKRNFVTLQDAWDKSDISMLRSMMTDEMVQEIRSQLAEREAHTGGQPNKTEVVMLEAHLLGIEELPDVYMASVEFSGMIREDMSAGPSPFREVWNMTRPVSGKSGWLVAGVQALQ